MSLVINTSFVALSASGLDGSGYSYNTANGFTYTKGRLYLFIVGLTGASSDGTIAGTTFTWTKVATVGDSARRIAIYRCLAPATKGPADNEVVVINSFGGSTGSMTGIWEIKGATTTGTNGSDSIVNSATGSTTGADPSITLSAITATSNKVIAVLMNDRNNFAGSPESGFTEVFDGGYESQGGYAMIASGATQDNTPTVTATSSTWVGLALEIRAWVAGLYPQFFPQGV